MTSHPLDKALMDSVADRDRRKARQALTRGADPNTLNGLRYGPGQIAVINDDPGILHDLIDHGLSFDVSGQTAINGGLLPWATRRRRNKAVKALTDRYAERIHELSYDHRDAALMSLAAHGYPESLKRLLPAIPAEDPVLTQAIHVCISPESGKFSRMGHGLTAEEIRTPAFSAAADLVDIDKIDIRDRQMMAVHALIDHGARPLTLANKTSLARTVASNLSREAVDPLARIVDPGIIMFAAMRAGIGDVERRGELHEIIQKCLAHGGDPHRTPEPYADKTDQSLYQHAIVRGFYEAIDDIHASSGAPRPGTTYSAECVEAALRHGRTGMIDRFIDHGFDVAAETVTADAREIVGNEVASPDTRTQILERLARQSERQTVTHRVADPEDHVTPGVRPF